MTVPILGAASSGQHAALLPFRFPVTLPSPGSFRSEARLARGKFLVASRHLRDPNFSETVVLLIDYDWHGAMGLVINRPSELRLSTVLPEIKGLEQPTDTVYIGGPVARSQMLLLIQSRSQPKESSRVFKDIYVSSSRTVLQRMIDDADAGEKFRVYAGNAGWAPGQLYREVSRGGWHVLEADAETVFDKAPAEVWPELIRRASVQWVRLQAPARNVRKGRHVRKIIKSLSVSKLPRGGHFKEKSNVGNNVPKFLLSPWPSCERLMKD
jgi:putative transcriptional regulator